MELFTWVSSWVLEPPTLNRGGTTVQKWSSAQGYMTGEGESGSGPGSPKPESLFMTSPVKTHAPAETHAAGSVFNSWGDLSRPQGKCNK